MIAGPTPPPRVGEELTGDGQKQTERTSEYETQAGGGEQRPAIADNRKQEAPIAHAGQTVGDACG